MSEHNIKVQLPPIPAKRYFTIGEVSELCGVKPHVLRYWEQEFTQLKPVKRRGNRRYYQHHEVLLIRRIRELLYEQGFTISGARNRLDGPNEVEFKADIVQSTAQSDLSLSSSLSANTKVFDFTSVKTELLEIQNLLRPAVSA
jgi:DNA-binding transcriptional MerR regulator